MGLQNFWFGLCGTKTPKNILKGPKLLWWNALTWIHLNWYTICENNVTLMWDLEKIRVPIGFEPMTFRTPGGHSIHWATRTRVEPGHLKWHCHSILALFYNAEICSCNKNNDAVLLPRTLSLHQTIYCCLSLSMATMKMDWNLKKQARFFYHWYSLLILFEAQCFARMLEYLHYKLIRKS